MSNELYDVEDIKNEYLKNVYASYSQAYSQVQVDLAIYMLNDFVSNLKGSGLVLLRYQQPSQQQGPPPQYAAQSYAPQMQQISEDPFAQANVTDGMNDMYIDPRVADVKREVDEMNAQLKQRQEVQSQDVSLGSEPKTFVDKIKEMRAPRRTDRINPVEE